MPPPEPVVVGELVAGRLRVLREIARGGMGVLYEAEDETLRRRVALKVMPAELASDAALRERALREARAVAQLQSVHAVQIFEIGTLDGGVPFLVLELLEGETLEAVLERAGPLPVETALGWVLGALGALAEAHARGLVHRDVKPANLFLARSANGEIVKVLDFGIVLDATASARLTQTGEGLGTPAYMAPEQVKASRDVDARADVWAMGVTLYELLTARMPFEAASIPGLVRKIVSEPPTPMSAHRAGLPASVTVLVERCLAQDPAARFPDARALREAVLGVLRELRPEADLSTGRVPVATAKRARATRPGSRIGLFAAVTGATLALGAGGLVALRASRAGTAAPAAGDGGSRPAPTPDDGGIVPEVAVLVEDAAAPRRPRPRTPSSSKPPVPPGAAGSAAHVEEWSSCYCLARDPDGYTDDLCSGDKLNARGECNNYLSYRGVPGSPCRGRSARSDADREGRITCVTGGRYEPPTR